MDELVVQGEISSQILTLRSKQVMLDRDLAKLYQVETKALDELIATSDIADAKVMGFIK